MTAIRGYVAPTRESDALGVHSLDQFVLGVGLETRQRMAGCRGARGEVGIDLGQRRAAVDLRLARAEQVEVGAVQDEDLGQARNPATGAEPVKARECARVGRGCPERYLQIAEIGRCLT